MSSKSFLGVTVYFLNESESNISDVTLGVYELTERYTGEYIAECLTDMCNNRGIINKKISCIVTDEGSRVI